VARTLKVDDSVLPVPMPSVPTSSTGSRVTGGVPALIVGLLYLGFGKWQEAERTIAEAVPLVDGEPAVHSVEAAQTLVLLGLARENQGKFADADRALTQAREICEALVGADDISTMRVVGNQARVWTALGRHGEAAQALEAALAVLKERGTDGEVAVALNDLGNARCAAECHRAAIPLFEEALARFELAEKETGKPIPDRATVLNNLARALDAVGARRDAADARRRAQKIRQP
jgi:tetratricopeptide (TPR) repeat protein